ncbi:imidazole glycerol phosphate synthase subunit hisF [Pseudomonas syringae]|uniref:imidazole glycerol phosphate synthase subunit hisF n=1 Tax=Pseudomonas syringae TaxID=317 RepID=UPI00215A2333|nr:imidazole glycerol phosphate synthase subunit hisF [Pseudomonas syringae]MCR8718451.1 imidazole glycerol phosphate synthase subunit hisF [Pseudomonas syringae]
MANNTLESISAWMKEPLNNVMLGWDSIAVMARHEVNYLLREEYISRFSSNTYLSPISGEVTLVGGRSKESMHDFILDAPRLAFSNNDLNKSHASLTCAILGGTQVTMTNNVDTWEAVRVICIDPLQGPRLTLDLSLDSVPGIVDLDGRVRLDLKESDNFILTFAETIDDQKLGGNFFKEWFKTLPDNKRVWTLAFIGAGNDERMRPQSFKIRTQTNPAASLDRAAPDYGDGAVLVFIRMRGSEEGGDIPVQYRYLIPDDAGKNYSATVLFDSKRLAKVALPVESITDALSALFDDLQFTMEYESAGPVLRAIAERGMLAIPMVERELLFYFDGELVRALFNRLSYKLWANSFRALTITQRGLDSAALTWTATWVELGALSLPGDWNIPLWMTQDMTVDLRWTYTFAAENNNDLVLIPVLEITSSGANVEINEEPPTIDGKPVDNPLLNQEIARLKAEFSTGNLDEHNARIGKELRHTLVPAVSVTSFIHEHIYFDYNRTLVADVLRAPRDIAVFGRINPLRADFSISPVEHMMVSGSAHKFFVAPAGANVKWAVECLQGNPQDYGAINAVGMYYAPTLPGDTSFNRMRVTATHGASGFVSSALVTVVTSQATLNPLIQVCDVTRTAELTAGEVSRGELLWSLKETASGEGGELRPSVLPDGDHTYIPRRPALRDKTYVLDEIIVTGKINMQAYASAWVLVTQKIPFLTIKLAANAAAGQVQLQAFANGNLLDPAVFKVNWEIGAKATGTISDTGLYSVAQNTTDRFVLIFAWAMHPALGKLEGHIILPLPLARFARELGMMSDKTAP